MTLPTPPAGPHPPPGPEASGNDPGADENSHGKSHRRDGVRWAVAGIVAGAGVSIAANVGHSYIPPDVLPPGVTAQEWSPPLGGVFLAVWWPIALFIALEVLASRQWPPGRLWWAVRLVLTGPVAAVAAVVSYHHLSGLLAYWGEDGFTVRFGPVAIDGLMGLCSALLFMAREPAGEPEPVAGPVQGEPLYEPVVPERPEGAVAAVYRLYDAEGSLLYVGCTVDPWTRLRAHRRRQPWWDEVTDAEFIWFPSVDLAADVEQQAIGTERPVYNIALNRYANHVRDAPEAPPVVSDQPSRELGSARRQDSLVECTCGQVKCSGWVGRSTRTRHRREVKDAAGLAVRASRNGHHDPVSVG